MSDRKTKRWSGAQYRKRKLQQESTAKKDSGAIKKFLLAGNSAEAVMDQNEAEPQTQRAICTQIGSKNMSSEVIERTRGASEATEDADMLTGNNNEFVTENINRNDAATEENATSAEEKTTKTKAQEFGTEDLQTEDSANVQQIAKNIEFDTILSDDPADWPLQLNNMQVQLLVQNEPKVIKQKNYPPDSSGRSFSDTYYKRTLQNGEICERRWLLYSVSRNSIFCFCCKIFSNQDIPMVKDGFSDWRHTSQHLTRHEKNEQHIINFKKWSDLAISLRTGRTIDKREQQLFEAEKRHWFSVIERILHVVRFLSQQNLAFRGSSSQLFEHDNGNFLKIIEMISRFDPVMSEHVRRVQNKQNQHLPTYLGNVIQNEIISLLADNIKAVILEKVKKAKYYSIILDCTPDVSHVEQITLIIRFVDVNANEKSFEVCEHFLGFSPITDSSGEGITQFILKKLKDYDLKIEDLRGQSYDNGANMRGKHKGVQKRILDINSRASFVPCAAHSLNLVVNDAAKVTFETVDFFNIVQELYVFFSASTQRWAVLKSHISGLTLKAVSDTRWESRINAIRPLRYHLGEVYDSLIELAEMENRDMSSRHQAQCLAAKLKNFKFLCSVVIWYELLSKVNVVSKMLQAPNLNFPACTELMKNLITFLNEQRTDEGFENFIKTAEELAELIEAEKKFPDIQTVRRRRVPTRATYEHRDEPIIDPKIQFKVNFYFSIMDTTLTSMNERFEIFKFHDEAFHFLYCSDHLKDLRRDELLQKRKNVESRLTDSQTRDCDISANELTDEITILRNMLEPGLSLSGMLDFLTKNDLQLVFPNLFIVLRILLTLPVSVAAGERSFSKLKIIKNYLRSTMTQERLTNLAMISIEHRIAEKLEVRDMVKKFSELKARKMCFKF